MERSRAVMVAVGLWAATFEARSQPYRADPRPDDNWELHVQPDVIAARPVAGTAAPVSRIGAVTTVDVLLSAGYDIAGADYGNEPAISVNPLNPSQIVLTSFSGSAWASGGNSTLFYSSNGGASWVYSQSVPPPTGTSTNYNCPCDQNVEYGRDGILYATFLHLNVGGSVQSVYSAQSTNPVSAAAWSYRLNAGVAKKTNLPALSYVDQPWLTAGVDPGSYATTQVAVAYDNFNSSFTSEEIRDADATGSNPPDFVRDAAANVDGQIYGDGMNPGNRVASAPDGKLWTVYQRYVSASGSIKQLTYLVNLSTNAGTSWGVANSDHVSGAKIVAANVYSFQGNGSKVGNVNALLGGVDAITVDPTTGTAWIVYGTRATLSSIDQLWLVSATASGSTVTLGTPHLVSPAATENAYLPAVAVLPSGEIGVLFLTWDGSNFRWRLVQTLDGGVTLASNTTLATFTSPFANNGQSNQRIFGDYVGLRAVGCTFYGTYCARGAGVNSISSIDPYFMSAPPAGTCSNPTVTSLAPAAVCAGGGAFTLTVYGTGFQPRSNVRVGGSLRATTYVSATRLDASLLASDIATPGTIAIDVLGATPGGVLTNAVSLVKESATVSPGGSLAVAKGGASNVALSWNVCANADSYSVRRCDASTGPCTPVGVASPATNSYNDPVLGNGASYWYSVAAVNACGTVP